MLENLRDKILNVQYDLSASFRNLATGDTPANRGKKQNFKGVSSNAGADLLHYYQQQWKELHENDAANAKKAEEVDASIRKLHTYCTDHLSHVRQINTQLAALPQLQAGIMDLMAKIGELEGVFEEVEDALVALEDVVEVQELQERQLDHRFQLAMYKEKRLADFDHLKGRLEEEHSRHIREFEMRQESVLRERHDTFQEVFEQDLKQYKAEGKVAKRLSSSHSVSLEDIELEQDQGALDEFLEDENAPAAEDQAKESSD